jgi:hypothetical protein
MTSEKNARLPCACVLDSVRLLMLAAICYRSVNIA